MTSMAQTYRDWMDHGHVDTNDPDAVTVTKLAEIYDTLSPDDFTPAQLVTQRRGVIKELTAARDRIEKRGAAAGIVAARVIASSVGSMIGMIPIELLPTDLADQCIAYLTEHHGLSRSDLTIGAPS